MTQVGTHSHSDDSVRAERAGRSVPHTVLLVDDKDDSRITLKWFLDSFGIAVHPARNALEALAMFNPLIHQAVVTDNSMPGITGAELAHIIKLRSPSTPVLMFTGEAPSDLSAIDTLIIKPALLGTVKEALDKLLAEEPPSPEPSGG